MGIWILLSSPCSTLSYNTLTLFSELGNLKFISPSKVTFLRWKWPFKNLRTEVKYLVLSVISPSTSIHKLCYLLISKKNRKMQSNLLADAPKRNSYKLYTSMFWGQNNWLHSEGKRVTWPTSTADGKHLTLRFQGPKGGKYIIVFFRNKTKMMRLDSLQCEKMLPEVSLCLLGRTVTGHGARPQMFGLTVHS